MSRLRMRRNWPLRHLRQRKPPKSRPMRQKILPPSPLSKQMGQAKIPLPLQMNRRRRQSSMKQTMPGTLLKKRKLPHLRPLGRRRQTPQMRISPSTAALRRTITTRNSSSCWRTGRLRKMRTTASLPLPPIPTAVNSTDIPSPRALTSPSGTARSTGQRSRRPASAL